MRLSDLETFVLAVQEGSLTAAARRLFLSQPAVSARLDRLEAGAGQPLLRRTGRGVRPTEAGERLYARARTLLEAAKSLEDELRPEGPLRGRLALGATDLVAVHHLPKVLARLRRDHPELELAVQVDGTAALWRALEEDRIELALATLPAPSPRFSTEEMFDDPILLVASPDHPAAPGLGRDLRVLAAEPWIHHKRDSITRQLVDAHFAARGLVLRTEMEISSPEAIKALVAARLGLAALPACSVQRELDEGKLIALRVPGFDLHRISGLVRRRNAPDTRATLAFLDALRTKPRANQPRATRAASAVRPGYAAKPALKTRKARRSATSSKT